MPLTRVTITGADDWVAPAALADLSAEFPFVEWGILFSKSRRGQRRYPTQEWVDFLVWQNEKYRMHLAAHLCGEHAQRVMRGDVRDVLDGLCDQDVGEFERVQINGFELPATEFCEALTEWDGDVVEFILQARTVPAVPEVARCARMVEEDQRERGGIVSASVLYDPSSGRGVSLDAWPAPPPEVKFGYAGGIKPSNVEQMLRLISGAHDKFGGDGFWIDMESGVRTGDAFDLGLVREVLSKAQAFVPEKHRRRL